MTFVILLCNRAPVYQNTFLVSMSEFGQDTASQYSATRVVVMVEHFTRTQHETDGRSLTELVRHTSCLF
jgi:hypothetical protein